MSNLKYDFSGKTALITGGAQGIGLQIAQQFLSAGARVIVWDYSDSALAAAQGELSKISDQFTTQAVDVTDRASVEAAASAISGGIEVLVNNAGITRDKSFLKMSPEEWDAVISTNITGLFNVTKALVSKFDQASTKKRIINIASVVALFGNFGQANYAAAKAGVLGFTRTLSKELARKGFTVNAVAPGFIKTSMTAAMPAEARERMAANVPVGRLGEASDIANAVLFLASNEAAYINGTVLSVDGGIVL